MSDSPTEGELDQIEQRWSGPSPFEHGEAATDDVLSLIRVVRRLQMDSARLSYHHMRRGSRTPADCPVCRDHDRLRKPKQTGH